MTSEIKIRKIKMSRKLLLAAALLVAQAGCGMGTGELSAADVEAVKDASQTYATAWLANDPELVMGTLAEEPVLIPSGLAVIEGAEAAREFWFPDDAPPSTINEFNMVQAEVGGSGNTAFVRGTFSLSFEYDGSTYSNQGNFISLLKKGPTGTWRISHHMWNDMPPPSE